MWWHVYILKSLKTATFYIGSTNNLDRRLREHNEGLNQSTKAFLPWKVEAFITVDTEHKARELEKYFKTGSGKAILNKRILFMNSENKSITKKVSVGIFR